MIEDMILGVGVRNFPKILCMALSRDGMHLASGSRKGTIIVYSAKTGNIIHRVDHIFAGNVLGLCYLPRGFGLVACGLGDWGADILKVYSPSLQLVQTLDGHEGEVKCVTVSPSGSHIVSGSDDGKVMVWSKIIWSKQITDWALEQVFNYHSGSIEAVCFSPDGKQLATGSDKVVKIYNFTEGVYVTLAHTLEGHTSKVNSISFSPDCKVLCSGSWDAAIKFWNPADGSLVKSIDEAHTLLVNSVSYSPNGRILVSSGNDKTMKIWDAETFELKHTFEQEFNTRQLTVTADSNFIVSANTDHTVRFTPCREYHITALAPILNLILHIVYKWEFVSFLEPSENTSPLEEVTRRLGECVYHGGYNVTSEILSFLSPAHLPIQITPTRWKSKTRNRRGGGDKRENS